MEFGQSITNGLLQVAVGSGEATIRHACAGAEVDVHVEMEQFADGRDAIQVTVRGEEWQTAFTMLLRNYFNRALLWRVARRAWQRRGVSGESRGLDFGLVGCRRGMN